MEVSDELDAVRVSVRDHGPGLSLADRARATDRFWRAPDAPPGGTGLGLAIVVGARHRVGRVARARGPRRAAPVWLVEIRLPHGR